ncbi:response regulator transcription factor [Microbulbifer sp. MLAF003]|uniref:winged helix-turn-helix domain-containing protein n=1 Tax=unclassified Microbulbifer TaxID=2619833 RepID=UPI0024AD7114|nr:response regulator transcription factor [Microbulbifer sp. MLAF003]WHI50221.1 response regulator transcription factor [Microbulbifer sp. MLAF003]
MRIFIIEDDIKLSHYLHKGLSQEGHGVELCHNGKTGLIQASIENFDVIILDRMLPGMDGLKLLKSLRGMEISTPVLMLSNLGDVDHRVEGLRSGCDDYLSKPFSFAELLARVEVIGRRQPQSNTCEFLIVSDLELNLLTRKAQRRGRSIELLTQEFKLLEYLMRHEGKIVTKTMLLEQVWDLHFDPKTNVVEVHVSRLRKKVDQSQDSPLIHTVRGAGYVLREKN